MWEWDCNPTVFFYEGCGVDEQDVESGLLGGAAFRADLVQDDPRHLEALVLSALALHSKEALLPNVSLQAGDSARPSLGSSPQDTGHVLLLLCHALPTRMGDHPFWCVRLKNFHLERDHLVGIEEAVCAEKGGRTNDPLSNELKTDYLPIFLTAAAVPLFFDGEKLTHGR